MDEPNTPTEPQPALVELAVVRFAEVPNVELHVPVGSTMQQVALALANMSYAVAAMGWNEAEQFKAMADDLKAEREGMEQAAMDRNLMNRESDGEEGDT